MRLYENCISGETEAGINESKAKVVGANAESEFMRKTLGKLFQLK